MAEYAVAQSTLVDTAERMRLAKSAIFPDIGSLRSRSGLVDGGGAVTLTSGMSVSVGRLRAFIQGTSGTTQGGYWCVLDTDKVLTFADGGASNRTDIIVARIQHNTYDGSGFTRFIVDIVQGVAGGGVPATPANAVKLAEKVITAGMSAGSGGLGTAPTDKRPPRLVAAGGIVPVVDASDRDTLNRYAGLTVLRLDTKNVEINRDGTPTGWRIFQLVSAGLPVADTEATVNTGSETAWTTEANPATVTFNAPDSGQVKVTLSAYLVNIGTGGTNAMLGLKVSGGLTRDPLDSERISARGAGVGGTFSRTYLLTGLTPGTSYTLTTARKIDSTAAAYVADRTIVVEAA